MCLALVALITSSDVAGLLLSIANLLTVSAVVSLLNWDALSLVSLVESQEYYLL